MKGGNVVPYTVPNQKTVQIHRVKPESDFLGIKNENWQYAARDLGAQGLLLYLYLSSNSNNYLLALSPSAIRQAVGMPTSTYRDWFKNLVDKGYLVQRGEGNTYDFYEIPQRDAHAMNTNAPRQNVDAANNIPKAQYVDKYAEEDREININKYIEIDNCGEEKQVSPSPLKSGFRF